MLGGPAIGRNIPCNLLNEDLNKLLQDIASAQHGIKSCNTDKISNMILLWSCV